MRRRSFLLTIAAGILTEGLLLSDAQARTEDPPEQPHWVKILLLADGVTIGAVLSATINETEWKPPMRDVDGTDLTNYRSPLRNITCTTTRARFDKERLRKAFKNNKVLAAWQRQPLTMKIVTPNLTTEVDGMWLLKNNIQYETDDFIVTDVSKWAAASINSRGDVAESG